MHQDPNSIVMVRSHGKLPYVAPLVLQNTNIQKSQYLVTLAGHDCFGRDSLVWLLAVLADVDSMLPSQAVRGASVSANGDVSP